MSDILAYVAAGVVFLWGTAHLVPTRQVVEGFGDLSRDNRLVITMEWVAEALAMWLVAALVVVIAAVGKDAATGALVYRVCAGFLVVLGAWTALTGARTPVVWFKACPVVMAAGAGLLVAASLV
jgi:hypothetical protein